jgi:hypothetical protein
VIWRAAPVTPADLTTSCSHLRAELTARSLDRAGAEDTEGLLALEERATNGLRHGRPWTQVVVADTGRVGPLDTAADLPPTSAVGRDQPPAV